MRSCGRASRASSRPRVTRTRASTGRGLARLEAAGVPVTVGVREAEARALNRAFLRAVTEGRPARHAQGGHDPRRQIAAADGSSRWITGEPARLEAHRLRFAADAILVGIGTVLADDPQLTVRHAGLPPKEPLRVVADSRLRMPLDARVLRAGDAARTVVACVAPAPAGPGRGSPGPRGPGARAARGPGARGPPGAPRGAPGARRDRGARRRGRRARRGPRRGRARRPRRVLRGAPAPRRAGRARGRSEGAGVR